MKHIIPFVGFEQVKNSSEDIAVGNRLEDRIAVQLQRQADEFNELQSGQAERSDLGSISAGYSILIFEVLQIFRNFWDIGNQAFNYWSGVKDFQIFADFFWFVGLFACESL
mgnify:FL=1